MDSTPNGFITAQASTPVQTPIAPTPAPQTGLDWTAILIPLLPVIVTGVLVGILSPMVAPYVSWRLEKLRERHQRRAKFIEDLQTLIYSPELSVRRFIGSQIYGDLRAYLSEDTKMEIGRLYDEVTNVPTNRDERDVHIAYVESSFYILLTQELIRLKKAWGFI